METTLNRNGDESAEEREKLSTDKPESKEPEVNQTKSHRWEPRAYRARDFAHVHPTHAKHKNFGIDHEPGAF
jgi:hypothetical protein